jgi:hypothetical protein
MIEGILQPRYLLVILAVASFLFGPKKVHGLRKALVEGNFVDLRTPSSRAQTNQRGVPSPNVIDKPTDLAIQRCLIMVIVLYLGPEVLCHHI